MNFYRFFACAIVLLSLAACSDPYQVDRSNMPEGLRERHETQLAQFEKELEESTRSPAEDIELVFNIAYKHELLGDYRKAIKGYLVVLDISPIHYATLNNLAMIYEELKDYDNAVKYIGLLHDNYEKSDQVIEDTVRILLAADRPDDAQKALESYIRARDKESKSNPSFISDLFVKIQKHKNKSSAD